MKQLIELLTNHSITIEPVSEQIQEFDMFDGAFVGQCSPIFRWAGGKTQLLSAIQFYAPKRFNTYFEPFIGGGALLFSLMPQRAVINDINFVLTNLYLDVKDNYLELLSLVNALSKLPDTNEVFMTIRTIFNGYVVHGEFSTEVSALFLYLNAKCFNGLYRVNSKGEFNVCWAQKDSVRPLISEHELKYVHDYLLNNRIEILTGDFLYCTLKAQQGDFVYFDPPYAPVSNTKNFTGYSKEKFTEQDQYRLSLEFIRLSELGVNCMLSNSDCPMIREMYAGFNIRELNVNYCIQPNSDDIHRKELLITNY